jgi:hypothetical protein
MPTGADSDRLARLAARLLGAPFAAVTGRDGELAAGVRLDAAPELWADALAGPLLLTGGPSACGVPLRAACGAVVGAVCVLDHAPRAWGEADVAALTDLVAAFAPAAQRDALTGLANRAELRRRLAAALDGARGRVSVLHLDLDDFKLVNDVLGRRRSRSAPTSGSRTIRRPGERRDVALRGARALAAHRLARDRRARARSGRLPGRGD